MIELVSSTAEKSIKKRPSSVTILDVSPIVDCGRFAAKRFQGDDLIVSADILKPGHEMVAGNVVWRMCGEEQTWNPTPMNYSVKEDRWSAKIKLDHLGTLEFFVEAWNDEYSKVLQDVSRWLEHDEDVSSEVTTLLDLVNAAAQSASPIERSEIESSLRHIPQELSAQISPDQSKEIVQLLSAKPLSSLILKNSEKKDYTSTQVYTVIIDRAVVRYSTWYEMFVRSQGTAEKRSATFSEAEARLQEIKDLGFDVVYLPPIHPIGKTNRRGPNNAISLSPNDPGSPWAIGNELGGHDAVNPDLGSIKDFEAFVTRANSLGLEIALDLAFQVSPDHPYIRAHPEWFFHRSDGSIKFAENPPKRYFDIYPMNFEGESWESLWHELKRIVDFWISHGIKIFRVDNPHTKPVPFWQWLISSIRKEHPDAVFLAEAFTTPKAMKLLAKSGFDQSYTYFTWKNTKYELTEFLKEFFLTDVSEYYRPNLFTNTPDILSEFLQTSGRPGFKIREVLAATLSSSYGIYNGFELGENRPKAKGSEEYLNSEKYQYKVWDWDKEGNIKDYISKLNKIRRENEALHFNSTLRLLDCDSEQIMFYGKWTDDLSNVILVAVNLDPHHPQDGTVVVPTTDLGLHGSYDVKDLVTDQTFHWNGERNYVRLDPHFEPAHVLMLVRPQGAI